MLCYSTNACACGVVFHGISKSFLCILDICSYQHTAMHAIQIIFPSNGFFVAIGQQSASIYVLLKIQLKFHKSRSLSWYYVLDGNSLTKTLLLGYNYRLNGNGFIEAILVSFSSAAKGNWMWLNKYNAALTCFANDGKKEFSSSSTKVPSGVCY